MLGTGKWKPRSYGNKMGTWSSKLNALRHHVSLPYSHILISIHVHMCGYVVGKSIGQPHSYTHERLKEQVGVVEAGMYWDIQRENSRLQAEKENAMAEFERIKQEV